MEEANMLLWPHVPNCTILPSQKRYSKRDERLDNTDLRGARTTFPQERDVFDRRAVCPVFSSLGWRWVAHKQRGDPFDAAWGGLGRHHSVPLPLHLTKTICVPRTPPYR